LREVPPEIRLYPDKHNKIFLAASLYAFQTGKGKKMDFGKSYAISDPSIVNDTLQNVRALLGYDPFYTSNGRLSIDFAFIAYHYHKSGIHEFYYVGDKK